MDLKYRSDGLLCSKKIVSGEFLTETIYNIGGINMTTFYYKGEIHRVGGPAIINYINETGDLCNESWYQNGLIHRTDGFAFIEYFSSGHIYQEIWYENGTAYREDGPYLIQYHENSKIHVIKWNNIDEKNNRPLCQLFDENGELTVESWYKHIEGCDDLTCFCECNNNVLQRENGPVHILYNNGLILKEIWRRGKYEYIKLYNSHGGIRVESYMLGNKLHRDDGPAEIRYYDNGVIMHKKYMQNGVLHNENGPACVAYHNNGKLEEISWYINGNYHRDKGPAVTKYYFSGNLNSTLWYRQGVKHRIGGPSQVLFYDKKGDVYGTSYYENGIMHRVNGPTITTFKNGIIILQCWIIYGECHRLDGPAYIKCYDSGVISRIIWYSNGYKHNEKGPAYVEHDMKGKIKTSIYYIYDIKHRIDGPAEFIKTPEYTLIKWYLYGYLHNDKGPAYVMKTINGVVNRHYIIFNVMISRQDIVDKITEQIRYKNERYCALIDDMSYNVEAKIKGTDGYKNKTCYYGEMVCNLKNTPLNVISRNITANMLNIKIDSILPSALWELTMDYVV